MSKAQTIVDLARDLGFNYRDPIPDNVLPSGVAEGYSHNSAFAGPFFGAAILARYGFSPESVIFRDLEGRLVEVNYDAEDNTVRLYRREG